MSGGRRQVATPPGERSMRIRSKGGALALAAALCFGTAFGASEAQAASVEALNGPQDFIAEHNEVFRKRRDLVVEMLNDTPGLSCSPPQGAFYVFPSCAGVLEKKTPEGKFLETEADFVEHLLEAAEIAAVPGEAFGLSPYFRISYATSTEILRTALTRIQDVCKALT